MKLIACLLISAALGFAAVVIPSTPIALTAGDSVETYLTATGGTAPYIWAITKGSLPTGLLVYPNGRLAGTLSAAGKWAYTLTATDAAGDSAQAQFEFAVAAPPIFSQENVAWEFKGRTGLWIARGVMIVAIIEDWRTTMQCVLLPSGACSEGNAALLAAGINPATARGSQDLLALKLIEPIGIIGAQEIYRRFRPISDKVLTAGTWVFVAGQTGVDINNRLTTIRVERPSALK